MIKPPYQNGLTLYTDKSNTLNQKKYHSISFGDMNFTQGEKVVKEVGTKILGSNPATIGKNFKTFISKGQGIIKNLRKQQIETGIERIISKLNKENGTLGQLPQLNPLETLYISGLEGVIPLGQELKAIGEKHGFKVKSIKQFAKFRWYQDLFINKLDKVLLRSPGSGLITEQEVIDIGKQINPSFKVIDELIEGGNTFIIEKPGTEPKALIGIDTLKNILILKDEAAAKGSIKKITESEIREAKKFIAQELEVPEKNLYFLSQADYHNDLGMVRVDGNDVFINNDELMLELLENLGLKGEAKKARKGLKNFYNEFRSCFGTKDVRTTKAVTPQQIKEELQSLGLNIIEVPGRIMEPAERGHRHKFRRTVNFLNAVLHKTSDEKIVYMTNSSGNPQIDSAFEMCLKEKYPKIKEVIFSKNTKETLKDKDGGMHCSVLEIRKVS